MTARKSPRRRKPQAPEPEPVAAPFLSELVDTLRAVAGRMIDLADAAAEAVTRRLEGRT